MRCLNCGARLKILRGDHRYAAGDGLDVMLKNIQKTSCPDCGEEGVAIPNIAQLNEVLAVVIAKKPQRLSPGEVRFLRKYLGWSGKDFAHFMGVTPETVSRWENGARRIGETAERLLRFAAVELDPIEDYPIPDLVESKKRSAIKLEMDEEWAVVA